MPKLAMLCLVLCASMALADDKAKPEAKTTEIPMIPDADWRPAAGDRAEVYAPGAVGSVDRAVLDRFQKFRKAADEVGMRPMLGRTVFALDKGTPVLVVKAHAPMSLVHRGVTDSDSYARELDAAIAGGRMPDPFTIEVRLLDGPRKDQIVFVLDTELARLVPDKKAIAAAAVAERELARLAKHAPKPVDPAARARTLLKSADNTAKAGKARAAAELYRQVVREYPGTAEARAAGEKLGGKL